MDTRKRLEAKFKRSDLVRTADKRKLFSKGDSTIWCNEFHWTDQGIDDTIPTYQINFLPEIHEEAFLRKKVLTMEESEKGLVKINLL